ncbi:LETM1 domain-containing protein 1-like [Oscarella lobularis]|uniref:LETM1 domain-containing protein 1-like n=1 Tax=Oscarella lobularis TaxID=121494 RepID=UPI00331414F5
MALLRQRCTLNRSQMVPCFFPLLKSIALSSNLPNSTPNSQSFFSRIKSLVKTFIGGCKLLWTDLKISRDLIIKEKHEKLTRRETQFILQTKRDALKLVPTLLAFCIPFVGYAVPPLAFLYPRLLLTRHFWTDQQKENFSADEYKSRFQNYLPVVKTVAAAVHYAPNIREIRPLCDKVVNEEPMSINEFLRLSQLFESSDLSLEKLPKYHLVRLCKARALPTWIPLKIILKRNLRKSVLMIYEDDLAIGREGFEVLTDKEMTNVFQARGFRTSGVNRSAMETRLGEWISLSKMSISPHAGGDPSYLAHMAVFKALEHERRDDMGDELN